MSPIPYIPKTIRVTLETPNATVGKLKEARHCVHLELVSFKLGYVGRRQIQILIKFRIFARSWYDILYYCIYMFVMYAVITRTFGRKI